MSTEPVSLCCAETEQTSPGWRAMKILLRRSGSQMAELLQAQRQAAPLPSDTIGMVSSGTKQGRALPTRQVLKPSNRNQDFM